MKRKRFSKDFKAKVALEAIKGQRTVVELAQEYGVHPNQISQWKKQALDSLPSVFGNGSGKDEKRVEEERDRLFKKVGQLQIEVDWLKKKTESLG